LENSIPIWGEQKAAVEQEARKRSDAIRLMTHPGVGPLTALTYGCEYSPSFEFGSYVGQLGTGHGVK
jgi:transposase